jgi:hypothetical protein
VGPVTGVAQTCARNGGLIPRDRNGDIQLQFVAQLPVSICGWTKCSRQQRVPAGYLDHAFGIRSCRWFGASCYHVDEFVRDQRS